MTGTGQSYPSALLSEDGTKFNARVACRKTVEMPQAKAIFFKAEGCETRLEAMNRFFTEIGRTVLARWKEQNFALARFPEIAQAVLEEHPPAKQIELSSLIRGVFARR